LKNFLESQIDFLQNFKIIKGTCIKRGSFKKDIIPEKTEPQLYRLKNKRDIWCMHLAGGVFSKGVLVK